MNPIIRLIIVVFISALTACQSTQPPALKDYPEFAGIVRSANGRFLGYLGYSLGVPGVTAAFWDTHSLNDVLVVPGTGDVLFFDERDQFNARANAFAREYNTWLLRGKI